MVTKWLIQKIYRHKEYKEHKARIGIGRAGPLSLSLSPLPRNRLNPENVLAFIRHAPDIYRLCVQCIIRELCRGYVGRLGLGLLLYTVILLLSYFISSGALDSPDLLLSYPTTTVASHITILLIIILN